jgi:hypothetical protein
MASDAPGVRAGVSGDGGRRTRARGTLRRLWYVLLLADVIVVLIPSIYARITPKLGGIPFFYWSQLAWIFVSMILTGLDYVLTTDRSSRGGASAVLHALRAPAGEDRTTPNDFEEVAGPALPPVGVGTPQAA